MGRNVRLLVVASGLGAALVSGGLGWTGLAVGLLVLSGVLTDLLFG
jgi:hypothetical protein